MSKDKVDLTACKNLETLEVTFSGYQEQQEGHQLEYLKNLLRTLPPQTTHLTIPELYLNLADEMISELGLRHGMGVAKYREICALLKDIDAAIRRWTTGSDNPKDISVTIALVVMWCPLVETRSPEGHIKRAMPWLANRESPALHVVVEVLDIIGEAEWIEMAIRDRWDDYDRETGIWSA